MSSGSRESGFLGRSNIKELFSNEETLSAIEDFQLANGILLPSLQPALPLLDLHGVSRLEFHMSVFEEMRECMINKVKEIAASSDAAFKTNKLNELLEKTMPVIEDKKFRPIVLCIMQHIPKIKPEYLQVIAANQVFYREASVEVKQQIWEGDQPLFGDEVFPILTSYIEAKESLLFSVETRSASFFQVLPKSRRQGENVQKLVGMVGKKTHLYEMILQFLRTLFLRTHNSHYCTLRSEFLMSFHDRDVSEIVSVDSCHKFAWCLDACVRERFVDNKRARELQGFLDNIRQSQDRVLGDLSMILCDPQAVRTICISILKNLQVCIANETNPRSCDDLNFLLRMLSMGLKAWQMIDSRVFKEPKLDPDWTVRLLPSIACLMVDDQIASLSGKSSDLEPPPAYLLASCSDDHLGATLLAHYALHLARQPGQSAGLVRILPVLCQCNRESIYIDTVLHELVSCLAEFYVDSFSGAEFFSVVFDKFFLPFCSKENVLRHVLRLVWWVHPKFNQGHLSELMNQLKMKIPDDSSVRTLHDSLTEKIKNYNQQQQHQLFLQQQAQAAGMATPTMSTPASFRSPTYVPTYAMTPSTPSSLLEGGMPFRQPGSMMR